MNFIEGKWIEGEGKEFSSVNPANGELIWAGNAASAQQVDLAIVAARKAASAWAKSSLDQRIKQVESYIELLKENRDQLAEVLCKDTGKAIWECRMELGGMISKFAISVEAYYERCPSKSKPLGKSPTVDDTSIRSVVRHKPHGVMAVFAPYNFPGHVPNGHILPALIAGNTIVLKGSERTPLICEEIMKLYEQSEIPAGVINFVQGEAEVGKALSVNNDVDGILFTGSSKIGKLLHQGAAGDLSKILALELGGNNPLLVHQASDIKATAYTIIQSAYISAGQRCTCARRLILLESEAEEILAELVPMIQSIKQGDPLDDSNFMGPVISSEQADLILQAQENLIKQGATTLVEAKRGEHGFISPGLLDCTGLQHDEEIFGPLLQVYKVKDWDEAIELANSTSYGLSAGLLSDSEELYQDFFFRIRAGIVNWNNQLTGASSGAPFGGIGDSGNSRPSAYYAADYCAYPVASLESSKVTLPEKLSPGISV